MASTRRAQCTNHRVVYDGTKSNHLVALIIADENFPRRGHHRNTLGVSQCTWRPRHLSHPGAVRGPQHYHAVVAIIHDQQKRLVGGQRQAVRVIELTGLVAFRTNSELPVTLHLKR